MIITTATIVDRCNEEELLATTTTARLQRIQDIETQLDNREIPYAGLQLACEAIKFHRIRLDGFDLQATLDRMVGPCFA